MNMRQAKPEDSKLFLELLKQMDHETEFMMLEPGERTTTAEDMEHYLLSMEKSNSFLLLAFDGQKVAGFLSARRGAANRIKHSAYIVCGVLKEYRGKGYGTSLFGELLKWAPENGITRLELTVMSHNEKAVRLYQNMGFELEGKLVHSMIVNGAYVDQYAMAKLI
jgi:RimJ/RimL family protein N-acetyltransferase